MPCPGWAHSIDGRKTPRGVVGPGISQKSFCQKVSCLTKEISLKLFLSSSRTIIFEESILYG